MDQNARANHTGPYQMPLSCPEIGLHKSVKIWKDIQELVVQSGNLYIQKNLKDLFVMII